MILVDPRSAIVTVHRPSHIVKVLDTLEVDDVVPGWKMTLAEIFAD